MQECCTEVLPVGRFDGGDTCAGSSLLEHLTLFRAETQCCAGCPIDPFSAQPLGSPYCCVSFQEGGREGERERQEELCSYVFSFPHPSSVLLSFSKVIAFLAHAGLREIEPSQEKGHLGGGLWSHP